MPGAAAMDKQRWHNEQVRILLVVNSRYLGAILRLFLERRERGARRSEFRVAGESATAEDALAFVEDTIVDLALIEAEIPGMGGAEATQRLRETDERLLVMGLLSQDDDWMRRRMLEAGAVGCISKDVTPDQLLEELREVARSERERRA